MKEEIIKLCQLIKENRYCKGCGNIKEKDGICKHCFSEDLEFKNMIDLLLDYLKDCKLDEDILLSLYGIRFLNCTEIHLILNQYNYNKFISDKLSEIQTKFNDIFKLKKENKISISDCKYIIYFLENKLYDEKELYSVTNFMMVLLICKQIELTFKQKLIIVKFFTQFYMKQLYPSLGDSICVFEEMQDDTLEKEASNKISLNEKKVNEYLEKEKYIELLKLIFHQCIHNFQNYQMINAKEASYINLLNVKERIIKSNIKNYYDENYYVCSLEVQARYASYELLLKFAKQFGWKSVKKYSENGKAEESKYIAFEKRKLNGNNTTVDLLFDSLNLKSSILKKFPVLNFEYKQGEEYIVRKSKDEIEQDYLDYLKEHGESEKVHYLFNKLINKLKDEESSIWFNRLV